MTFGVVPPLDPEADRWWLNHVPIQRYAGVMPRWTRGFHLHTREQIDAMCPEMWGWMAQQTAPIYLPSAHPEIPSSVPFPHAALLRRFGVQDFAGSLSWVLALAIWEGYEAIDVFYCPMNDPEHVGQVPSVRFWMGVALGCGARVTVHGDSALHPSPMYWHG